MTDKKFKAAIIKVSLLALFIFVGAGKAQANGETWLGGASGNPNDWNTAANWSPAGVPTASQNVTIPAGATYYPILNTTAASTIKNLTISSGGSMTINPGGSLTLSYNLTLDGTLNISGGSLLLPGGNVTLNG